MYKIFLVEDEIVVRESIRDSVPWEKTEFIFAGEAPDGEIALPLIQKIQPDILITDIKMPFMDGLELSSYVKKNMPHVKVIMISGHQDFSYAKKAISIGVEEYVLKPINSKELLEILRKVVNVIEKEKSNQEKLECADKYIIENYELVKEKVLNEILMETISPHQAANQLNSMGIDIYAKYYSVMNVVYKFNRYWDPIVNTQLSSIVENLIRKNLKIIKFNRSLREIVLIIKGEDYSCLREVCQEVQKNILQEAEKMGLSNISVKTGSIQSRIQGIALAYKEIKNPDENDFIIHQYEEIIHGELKNMSEEQQKYSKFDEVEILDAMRCHSKQGIIDLIQRYFDKIRDADISPIWRIYLAIRINLIFSDFLTELGENALSIVPKQTSIEEVAIKFDTNEKLQKYMEEVCLCGLEFRNQRKNSFFEVVEAAKKYIDLNYSAPDISLHEVSKHLHISSCYFSSIFSRETGSTFMQYLTHNRMKKAKTLLQSSNLKAGEIGLLVGYKDTHYFSYIFKKNIGCNPSQYKKSNEY